MFLAVTMGIGGSWFLGSCLLVGGLCLSRRGK